MPQRGDLAINTSNGSNTPHIGIVVSYGGYDSTNGHWAHVVDGNWRGKVSAHDTRKAYLGGQWVYGYVTPNYTTSYNPQGCLDSVTAGNGTVTVAGWAFDRDQPTQAVTIHAYIGGPSGSAGAEGINIGAANTERGDVERAYPSYGIGKYHGFNKTLTTSKRGSQPVYVYAINLGAGTNVLLGSKTVTVGTPVSSVSLDMTETTKNPAKALH